MERAEIRELVLQKLGEIAPDIDAAELDAAAPIRDQYDFDSMDLLNFAIALHKTLGIDIPERDYGKLAALDGAVDYLAARLQ